MKVLVEDNESWLFSILCISFYFPPFQDIITNVFQPLFEVTANPKSHPELHAFLQYVTGFDSVDDESKSDKIVFNISTPTPDEYDLNENPPYSYYIFYMYANIAQLNQFRSTILSHLVDTGHSIDFNTAFRVLYRILSEVVITYNSLTSLAEAVVIKIN
ncbi:unnamed protein product [Trichobilharzia regenti]|nr:unnamed protein product [Trichobilharzia regenti]